MCIVELPYAFRSEELSVKVKKDDRKVTRTVFRKLLKDFFNQYWGLKITEELKEVVGNELKVFLIKETQGQSSSVVQRTTKIHEGSKTAQLGSLLENANNQSIDGAEKNDLSQVASASFDFDKTQNRYSKLISEKLLSFFKEKITYKTLSGDFQVSIQKASLDITPIPPEGKGAHEKLKNISQAILNLAFAPAAVGSLYNPIKRRD